MYLKAVHATQGQRPNTREAIYRYFAWGNLSNHACAFNNTLGPFFQAKSSHNPHISCGRIPAILQRYQEGYSLRMHIVQIVQRGIEINSKNIDIRLFRYRADIWFPL